MTHTSTEQPEALRLAQMLKALGWRSVDKDLRDAATELERLHARVHELEVKVETGKRLLREEMERVNRYAEAPQARVPLSLSALQEALRKGGLVTNSDAWTLAEQVFELLAVHGITQEKQG